MTICLNTSIYIDNWIRTSYRVALSYFVHPSVCLRHPCIFRKMSFKKDGDVFYKTMSMGDNFSPLLGEALVPCLDLLLGGLGGHLDLGRRRCQLWWDLSRTWRVQRRGVAQDGEWVSRMAELDFWWFWKIVTMMVIKIVMIRMISALWKHRKDDKQKYSTLNRTRDSTMMFMRILIPVLLRL